MKNQFYNTASHSMANKLTKSVGSIRRSVKQLVYLSSLAILISVFGQGCSDVNFATSNDLQSLRFPQTLFLRDVLLYTQMNTPVAFTAEIEVDDGSPRNLMADANGSLAIKTQSGSLEILDAKALKVRYTPGLNFRGDDEAKVFMRDRRGRINEARIRIQVENPITSLQPGLAVRGTGCVMCHANVNTNVITDFGFGGDSKGHDYFFGKNSTSPLAPLSGSIYGDHEGNWKSVNLNGNVFVPRAPLSGSLANLGSSLADYLRRTLSQAPVASSRAAQVIEKDQIYIGAPSVERIREVAGLTSGESTWNFAPESRSSLPLSGIKVSDNGRFVTNSSSEPLVCSGDIAVEGVVYLKNLKVNTTGGCRIYATRSVFIEGPIEYINDNGLANLQIVSARSINLGLGYDTCGLTGVDPITDRLNMWTAAGYAVRGGSGTTNQKLGHILNDAQEIGKIPDASCLPGGRETGFDRLILNAPQVNSRYKGIFRGTIISEIAVMSLGSLKFEFDPVFLKVPVLPLLKTSDYLQVK